MLSDVISIISDQQLCFFPHEIRSDENYFLIFYTVIK